MRRRYSLIHPRYEAVPERRTAVARTTTLSYGLVFLLLCGIVSQGCKASPPASDSVSSKGALPMQEPSAKKNAAQAKWEALFKDDPESYEEYQKIQEEFRASNHQEAIKRLEALLQTSPEAAWAEAVEFQLVQILRLMHDYPRAMAKLDSFLEHHPSSPAVPGAYLTKGEILLLQGKGSNVPGREQEMNQALLQEALSIFLEIPQKYPGEKVLQAQALFHAATAYMIMEDTAAAKKVLRRVADEFIDTPYPPKALYSLANMYLAEADTDTAGKILEEIVERFSDKSEAQKAKKNLEGIRLVGKRAPDLKIKEWIGEVPPDVGTSPEKVRLLSFWAIWCPHCRKNIPKMNLLQKTYASMGLQVVGVSREREGKGAEQIREFIDAHPMAFSTGVDDEGKTSASFRIENIPRVVAIDAKGRVRWHGHPDYLSKKVISVLLSESSLEQES